MSNSIEEYLAELRKRLNKQLSPSEVEAHLTEARQHLECAATEYGGGLDAEQTATHAFGDSKKVSAQLIHAHSPRSPWAAVGAITCLVGVPLSLLLIAFLFQRLYSFWPVLAGFIVLTFLFICFSVRTGKLLSKQIAVAGIAVIFLFPMLECFMFVTTMPEVGHGLIPRFEAHKYIAHSKKEAAQLAPIEKFVSYAQMVYGMDSKALRQKVQTQAGYIVPVKLNVTYSGGYGADYSLETRAVATYAEAKSLWEKGARGGAFSAVHNGEGYASTVGDELQKPIFSEYRIFLSDDQTWRVVAVYFLLMFVLNYFCVSIPIWLRRVRRIQFAR